MSRYPWAVIDTGLTLKNLYKRINGVPPLRGTGSGKKKLKSCRLWILSFSTRVREHYTAYIKLYALYSSKMAQWREPYAALRQLARLGHQKECQCLWWGYKSGMIWDLLNGQRGRHCYPNSCNKIATTILHVELHSAFQHMLSKYTVCTVVVITVQHHMTLNAWFSLKKSHHHI